MTTSRIRPPFGKKIDLGKHDPGDVGSDSKAGAIDKTEQLREKFVALQEKLYAEGKQSLLIVLQAMDTGGKDGTIRHVFGGVNPQGVVVTGFKAPSLEELGHDFLWRIHQRVPPRGMIGVFNRSHYEDVLVVRVNKLAPKETWEKRYDQINAFERHLSENGVRILKFFLHISKKEQMERLQARLDAPDKRWKFSVGDLPVREKWNDYMNAYEDAIERCHTEHAPWHIVPANHKWYRNLVVTRAIVDTLEEMNPCFPKPTVDLDNVVIPD